MESYLEVEEIPNLTFLAKSFRSLATEILLHSKGISLLLESYLIERMLRLKELSEVDYFSQPSAYRVVDERIHRAFEINLNRIYSENTLLRFDFLKNVVQYGVTGVVFLDEDIKQLVKNFFVLFFRKQTDNPRTEVQGEKISGPLLDDSQSLRFEFIHWMDSLLFFNQVAKIWQLYFENQGPCISVPQYFVSSNISQVVLKRIDLQSKFDDQLRSEQSRRLIKKLIIRDKNKTQEQLDKEISKIKEDLFVKMKADNLWAERRSKNVVIRTNKSRKWIESGHPELQPGGSPSGASKPVNPKMDPVDLEGVAANAELNPLKNQDLLPLVGDPKVLTESKVLIEDDKHYWKNITQIEKRLGQKKVRLKGKGAKFFERVMKNTLGSTGYERGKLTIKHFFDFLNQLNRHGFYAGIVSSGHGSEYDWFIANDQFSIRRHIHLPHDGEFYPYLLKHFFMPAFQEIHLDELLET